MDELLSCSFCGKHQKHIKRLIAGPGVYICNQCLDRVHMVLAGTAETASTAMGTIALVGDANRAEPCSFCGKPRDHVIAMASTGHAQICSECIQLCDEVVSEEEAELA